MSLTKQDIANTLVKKMKLSQTQALSLTNQFFDQIIETLKTGEEVMISARKVVTFKAGPKLKLATQKGN
jgi:integration host factor subunit alpha